jgi:hypothetical protein
MRNAERENFKRFDLFDNTIRGLPEDEERKCEEFLKLNIGGTSYLLLTDALLRNEPTSFLAKFHKLGHHARLKVADAYLNNSHEYYFQRSPHMFDAIFHFYATGVINYCLN